MKVLVCGGRDYDNIERVFELLERLHKRRGVTLVIEGGATGADQFARRWAQTRSIQYRTFSVSRDQWAGYLQHRAGMRRNQRMLDEGQPDLVLAFPGGRGTRDMISRAKSQHFITRTASELEQWLAIGGIAAAA